MSQADWEEPPPKKRRFFVEDPIDDASLQTEPTLPDEVNALPETLHSTSGVQPPSAPTGFDEQLFASIVDDHNIAPSSIRRLRDLSGDNLERGMHSSSHQIYTLLRQHSNQYLPRWVLARADTTTKKRNRTSPLFLYLTVSNEHRVEP